MSTAPEEADELSGPQVVAGETARAQAEPGALPGPRKASEASKGRFWMIIGGTVLVAGPAVVLQVMAALPLNVPDWSPSVVVINAVLGLVLGFCGLLLFVDTITEKWGPRTVKAIGIALAIYALAQALTAFLILSLG